VSSLAVITHPQIWLTVIVVTSLALMPVRAWRVPEVYWIAGGVLMLLLLRLESPENALSAAAKGTDVYLFLGGMMLLSELASKHGVFDWLACAAVRHSNGSSARLFFLIYAAGTLVTMFMSNDATAVVLTPAVLVAVRKARIDPVPYLFVCAFIANAASFVLPISNPANLVVFQKQMPALGAWLLRFGVPSMLSIAVTYVVLRWYFRERLRAGLDAAISDHVLDHHGKMMLAGLLATAVILLVASTLNWDLGLPTFATALVFATVVSISSKSSILPLFREISWSTLGLVAALFVMVDAVERFGAMQHTRAWLESASHLGAATGGLLIGFAVAVANNLVNNLPLGLIAGRSLGPAHAGGLLGSVVLIGVDLGPNLSITGSLATILWLIALRKQKLLDVSFGDFLRIGALCMPAALLASLLGAIGVHLLLGWR